MKAKIAKGDTVHVKHPIEEAVFKFIPKDGKVHVLVKSKPKGQEYPIEERSNFATDAFMEGEEITQEQYENF